MSSIFLMNDVSSDVVHFAWLFAQNVTCKERYDVLNEMKSRALVLTILIRRNSNLKNFETALSQSK